ncbi:MAG: ROK family protein [bacterium]|nr:ROK family protein [bacterium]
MKVVLDIGGTNTRIAVSDDGHTLRGVTKEPTPVNDPQEGIDMICRTVKRYGAVESIAGGIAGVLSKDKSELIRSPNIEGWIGYPIKQELQKRLGVGVVLENDTAVVGLGEAHMGAGTSEGIFAYITVSTGVGGVRIVDGVVDRSTYGFEIGHQYIDLDRSACVDCPDPGDLESYISGRSLQMRYNKKPYEITDPRVWEEEARFLAVGLANTIVHWSPQVIVLGGSMIVGSPCIEMEHVISHVRRLLTIFPELPEFKKAQLDDRGGLYGALMLTP